LEFQAYFSTLNNEGLPKFKYRDNIYRNSGWFALRALFSADKNEVSYETKHAWAIKYTAELEIILCVVSPKTVPCMIEFIQARSGVTIKPKR
jgi:hypothetical protein